jgi:hypothetical protein
MKLTLNIVGETIQDIENALDIFMEEVKNKTLESNCYCGSIGDGTNTEYDYDFSDGMDVFNDNKDELTVNPYTGRIG